MTTASRRKSLGNGALRTTLPPDASLCIGGVGATEATETVPATGFEPVTLSSVDCAPGAIKPNTPKALRQDVASNRTHVPAAASQSIDWYAEGEERIVEAGGVRIAVRFVARKGRRARIAITAPPGAAFRARDRNKTAGLPDRSI